MSVPITWQERLTESQVAAVDAMLDRVSAADGVSAISEHTYLHLLAGGGNQERHALAQEDGQIVGYAFLSAGEEPVAEFLVDPGARGRGIGSALLEDILSAGGPGVRLWAHGQLPAANALATGAGLHQVRLLCRYTRTLQDLPDYPLPDGVQVRSFNPQDAAAWLELNAIAFADLPDQGAWTADDLAERLKQPWFDPEGFLLAFDDEGLVGFHWTKVHGGSEHAHERTGEVYVLAVAPRARGTGLGSALTVAGLKYLQGLGLHDVMLYVDADNASAVALYTRLGFARSDCDAQYAAASAGNPRGVSGTLGDMTSATAQTPEGVGDPPELPEHRFIDRELSWLAFNQRVLELSENEDLPLLERAKFLAIFASNLDEFFMVRVAGLKRRIAAGIAVRAASGLLPREVHDAVLVHAHDLMRRQAECWSDEVRPALAAEGITLVRWSELDDDDRRKLATLFRDKIYPVLTPLAVDPAHPFPYISGLSLNLAVVVGNPQTGSELFARVKVPPSLDRFLAVGNSRFVPLEDVIAEHLDLLFPGMDVLQHHVFRVTRNEDLEVEEDDAENLLKALERELSKRRFGPPVRLEVEQTIDQHVLDLLIRELGVADNEVFVLPGPLDLRGLWAFVGLNREDLSDPAFVPKTNRALMQNKESASAPNVLEAMRQTDVLLHHPYDSFSTSVQRFLEQAAADPKVLAIKQTLYRTSGDSPIIDALIDAAETGKQVLALVEIKARFDESANIKWARKLERAGVHVVYGLVGLKTHCKLSMVVRDDGERLRRYCHIGTGNYHPKTARLYEDFGLLTVDEEVGQDVANLFNQLSGYSMHTEYHRLLVAPHSIRKGLLERIDREIANHEAGLPARVRFKCNSIVDEKVIDALYRASTAGVPVDVLVRGICAIRPQVPGMSENLRVRSILGRFLEHSRAYEFLNGGDPEVWIGSADLMHRNLDRRVETLVSLQGPDQIAYVGEILDKAFDPGTSAWDLEPDGQWIHNEAPDGRLEDFQAYMIRRKHLRGG